MDKQKRPTKKTHNNHDFTIPGFATSPSKCLMWQYFEDLQTTKHDLSSLSGFVMKTSLDTDRKDFGSEKNIFVQV